MFSLLSFSALPYPAVHHKSKSSWTQSDDELLTKLAIKYEGDRKWLKKISDHFPGRDSRNCWYRLNCSSLNPLVKRGAWSEEEDKKLVEAFSEVGRDWKELSSRIPGRSIYAVRYRWRNHLNPELKHGNWSEEEDRILSEAHKRIGDKWVAISKELPGRSDISIRKRWYSVLRFIHEEEGTTD